MKIKEHVAVQNNSVMKSSRLSSLNLRNLCVLGCIFGLTAGLISTPYLQSSFRTAIDEGKFSQMIPQVEPSQSYRDKVGPESHSDELSDSKGTLISRHVNRNSGTVVTKKLKIDKTSTTVTLELEGQALSEGSAVNEVFLQTSPSQTLITERARLRGEEEEEVDGGPAYLPIKNLDEDCTPKSADTDDEQDEADVTPITKGSEGDAVDSNSIHKKATGEDIERLMFSEANISSVSEAIHLPLMPEGGEFRDHRRKNPDGIKENDLLRFGPNQKLRETGEEGSFRRDFETILQEKASDEDDCVQLLSPDPEQITANSSRHRSVVFNATQRDQCDIFKGHWIPDPLGPLYSSNSCRVLSQAQNCQDNGRADREYEFYRWQPQECDLPRLEPLAFLEFMEGKTLAFIGDSVARNEYESLMCILSPVSEPKNRGSKNMHRWFFPSHRFTLVRMWSGWLVRQTKEPFSFAPEDSVKLFLDELDEFADSMPRFDVAVISSGHWWMRQTTYILGGKIRGGYGWNTNVKSKKIDQGQAFGIAMKNVLKNIGEIPNYKGLTVLRTYSPDHYEGGRWDTGGSCTGKTEPYGRHQLPKNIFNEMMRSKQMDALKSAMQRGSKRRNGSSLALLDVFEALNFRPDGHPGPYRNRDPNKRTHTDEKGQPPPQDCLHWCMPGPVDTMNQLLFEVLRREFQKE